MKRLVFCLLPFVMCIGGCSISCNYTVSHTKRPNYATNRTSFMEYIRKRTVLVKVEADCGLGIAKSWGSGVILASGGGWSYVLTANHVVGISKSKRCTTNIKVGISDWDNRIKRFYKAKVLVYGNTNSYDVAILHVPKNFGVSTGLVERAHLGSVVHSLGFPVVLLSREKNYLTYTSGVVSTRALNYNGADYVSFTARIYYGNSGGGIWTSRGELVAITTDMYRSSRAPYVAAYGPSAKCIRKFLKEKNFGFLLQMVR